MAARRPQRDLLHDFRYLAFSDVPLA